MENNSYRLIGGRNFSYATAKFSHIGKGDVLVYKDCRGNFGELYFVRSPAEAVRLSDLEANDLELLPDLSYDDPSQEAITHLLELGFPNDKLPARSAIAKTEGKENRR